MCEDDFTIVNMYGSEFRGIVQYYAYAENRFWLNRLQWAMGTSLLKTLASKHKSTVSKMARKYKTEVTHKGRTLKCFQAKQERPGKTSMIAQFGGIRLRTDPFLTIQDQPADQDHIPHRSGLITRLLADECELCGSNDRIQVHHVRKLANLKVKGQKEKPLWMQIMANRRRKTLVVCTPCHTAIHAGKPTRTRVQIAEVNDQTVTGEPCASKVASTVRRGADGKGPIGSLEDAPF
jgi:hypothetical protein